MNFDLSEQQLMLRDQARRFLGETVSYDKLRAMITAERSCDDALWNRMAELGWLGISIPEEFGGLGLDLLDQSVIAEELGRFVAPVPFVSSAGMASQAILLAGDDEQKSSYLPRLASGEIKGAFAYFEGPGVPGAEHAEGFTTTASSGRLRGRKWPVLDAGSADVLVVCVRDADGQSGLVLVDAASPGVTCTPIAGFDQLRRGYTVEFDDAPCLRLGGDAAAALQAVFDHSVVLTAFEQVGGAQAALELATAYAKERRAFGRAIGSYQAIKHKLADMLAKIELARSNAYYAGWALGTGAPDGPLAAATVRLSAIDAYEFAARENMQIHGGIGFTWEANCHFHYRRSRLLATFLGASSYWSRRVVTELLRRRPDLATAKGA